MNLKEARTELALVSGPEVPAAARSRAVHEVLVRRGIEAFGISPRPGLGVEAIVRHAADAPPSEAPPTEARRAFAVLLVDAIGAAGLLPLRGAFGSDVRRFLESAMLNPLRRAGYRFDATAYDKNLFLNSFYITIDEHLRPLEPSIPRWLHGVSPPDDFPRGDR
jgi:hypothetical protein